MTVSFGQGDMEGHTYLRDGHADRQGEFWGEQGDKQHDHYGPGRGHNDNGTERGRYTGYGS